MQEAVASSVRLRHIGRTLRELRDKAGMTLKTAERRLDRSASSLSLIEKGQQSIRPRDLKYILDVYEVGPDLHRALMTLAEQERRQGWGQEFKNVISTADLDYASLEWDATRIDAIETQFVPGLLQTEGYARAIVRASLADDKLGGAESFVKFRMARQRILRKTDPPRFRVVIDEAALRRARGGPAVMRGQLHRLLDDSAQSHIVVQVLPFSCAADPGVNEMFSLLEIGEPSILSTVLISLLAGRRSLEDGTELARYRETFERACEVALSETDSRTLIQRLASEL
jgi:transcriptional regulator with XRE-family HTH domain